MSFVGRHGGWLVSTSASHCRGAGFEPSCVAFASSLGFSQSGWWQNSFPSRHGRKSIILWAGVSLSKDSFMSVYREASQQVANHLSRSRTGKPDQTSTDERIQTSAPVFCKWILVYQNDRDKKGIAQPEEELCHANGMGSWMDRNCVVNSSADDDTM